MPDAAGIGIDLARNIERNATIAQEPDRAAFDKSAAFDQHRGLQRCRKLIVEALDSSPQLAHIEDVAGDRICPCDILSGHSGLFLDLVNEPNTHAIDHAV